MKHYVTIANGRRVGIAGYVAGVKAAIANPKETFAEGLSSWGPTTGAVIRQQFLDGVHDRINQKDEERPRARRLLGNGSTPVGVATTTGFAAGRARIHRNQAQWRRRLVGKSHVFEMWADDCDVEPTYICAGCERRHGVPGADGPYYRGSGFVPLQHVGRDRDGNALIPWCDHERHDAAA